MSFLGNRPDSFGYTSQSTDHFNGDGSTVSFTLSRQVGSFSDIQVVVNNVIQDPGVAYTLSSPTTLLFTGAPSAGTGNIYVVYKNFINSTLGVAANAISAYSISANTIQPYHLASGLLTPIVDIFTANGATSTFTLSQSAASSNGCVVSINGLIQSFPANYSVTGNVLTFTSIPANNSIIRCEQRTLVGTGVVPLDGSIVNSKFASGAIAANTVFASGVITGDKLANGSITRVALDIATANGTGAMLLPTGTTAQRPTANTIGYHRFNTTTGLGEFWNGTSWTTYGNASPPTVTYLMVAGGGGGGGNGPGWNGCGGGGAGGLITGTVGVVAGTQYTVTVGAGGSAGVGGQDPATQNGGNTTLFGGTALGGGGGGNYEGSSPGGTYAFGAPGGSGGGAKQGAGGSNPAGSGTPGQGYPGGASSNSVGSGGGGGGAGAAGQSGTAVSGPPYAGGYGGVGVASTVSGSPVYYAGGGGGGTYNNGAGPGASGGAGGNGGGGQGSPSSGGGSAAGTTNTGGGGGGNGSNPSNGSAGGSGVVIISYPTSYKLATTSGTVTQTSVGGNYIFTFTGSGTITF